MFYEISIFSLNYHENKLL